MTQAIRYPVTDKYIRLYLNGKEVFAEYETEIDEKYLKVIVFDHQYCLPQPTTDENAIVLTMNSIPKHYSFVIMRRKKKKVDVLHKGKCKLIYDVDGPDPGMITFIFKLYEE